jgi:peptidoglycan/xylan/chitin deacetylase (PgdA/CDA1 family)
MNAARLVGLGIATCFFAAYGSSTAQTVPSVSASGLPTLAKSGAPKPAGSVGNLKVLDWAGLASALTYTFDDSLPSQIANYPQLHATGIWMTFFLNSSSGYNPAWTQIAKDGNELGNHTAHHCHADGSACGTAWAGSIEAEYDQCTAFIQQNYGVNTVWTTASPFGDTGFDTVARTRFFLNRGVWDGQIAANDTTDPYNLLIRSARAGDTATTFNSFIDSAHKAGKWQILLFHSLGGDGGYAPVNIADVIASINHAKSFGDEWIDSMVNVGAYWAGQKAVTDAVSKKSGKDTMLTWTLPPHFPLGKYLRVTVTGGTLKQDGKALPWNDAGYYEIALDSGSLTISQ